MLTATRVLFQRTGVQFVVRPSTKPFNRISLKLDDATPEDAVRYICQAAGAYFQRDDNGVFIISQEPPVVVPVALSAPVKKVRSVKRIKVLNQDVRALYDLIKFNEQIDTNRGFTDMNRFLEVVKPGSQQMDIGHGISRFRANQNSFGPENPVNQQTPVVPSERAADILLPGESADQRGGGGGRGGAVGGGGGGGGLGQGGGGGLGQGGGQGGQGGGQPILVGGQGLLTDLTSIDFISYDPTDNSLIVRGNEDDINALRNLVNQFDTVPQQVEIKVEFIAVTGTLQREIGFEFNYQRLNVIAGTTPGTFAPGGLPVFLNYATGNVVGRLRASLTESNGKVINSPIVRTLNNQPATVFSFQNSYFFLPQIVTGTAISQTTFIPVAIQAGTSLTVAPRINGDGTITLYLAPQVGGFNGQSVGPDGQIIPNQFSQGVQVVARMRNNETIVLGGLTTKNDSNTIQKVPVLADIPIIGQFFRRTRRDRSENELLIFVTPRIIEDDTSGTAINPR